MASTTVKNTNQRGVVFIEPNRLTFYRNDTGLKKMDITPDIIKDMEVLRREKLPETIKAFMTQQPIAPGPITLVITDYFMYTKSFTNDSDHEKQKAVQEEYLSNVPFEKVVHTEISTSASTVVLATNEDLCLIFARTFEGLGFTVEQAIPATVFTQIKVAPTGPDEATMQLFLQHVEENKKYNLIAEHRNKMVAHGHQKEQEAAKKTEAKRLPILVGLFGLLLIVLVLVMSSSQATSTKPQTTKVNAEGGLPTLSPTPAFNEETGASSSATLNRQGLALRILSSSQAQSKANTLRALLLDAGYTNVVLTATSSAISQSIIQVKSSLNSDTKQKVIGEIKNVAKVNLFEELSDAPFDASIQLAD